MLYFYLGLKYEKENEEDLKDQINFPKIPKKYPPNCKQIFNRQSEHNNNNNTFLFFSNKTKSWLSRIS